MLVNRDGSGGAEGGGSGPSVPEERDEAGDRRDEAGDRRDEAGDRRDEAGDQRDEAGDQRDEAGDQRDEAGDQRDEAGDQRDEAGAQRDEAGAQRDEAGDQRDEAGDQRDEAGDQSEASAGAGMTTDALNRSALARREAASDRRRASQDRGAGASDRTRAELDRNAALADRGAGASERTRAELDRNTALADRGAGASDRTRAELDRNAALADRGAGASERTRAELDRNTALADRGAGASERTRAELDRNAALADRGAGARLLDAVMAVGADGSLAVVLERITTAARELVDARYAALGVLDRDRSGLSEFITVGLSEEERSQIGDLPKGHGILGLLIVEPKPLRLPDLTAHPDSFGFPPGHPPMTSFLGVPLYVRGEVFGNLYLTDKQGGGAFSDIDEELVLSLAVAAALAIENVRLHERTGELSLLADRERIGRDLHDTVLQRLFAIGLAMQGTLGLAIRPEVVDRLQQHIEDLDGTMREIRSAIFGIDAAGSSSPSLRRDVLDLVAESARMLGFKPTVYFEGPIDTLVPDNVAGHMLPVLREALSNVARHAGATHVDVTVRADSNLSLEVVDDGRGVALEPGGGGNGLRNMMRRAQELGGRADIGPGADRGTTLQWVVPLRAETPGPSTLTGPQT